MLKPPRHCIRGLLLALAIMAADQLSKQAILSLYHTTPPPIEITPFFNLVMVWNRGMSFGLFSEHDALVAMIGITLSITLGVVVWLWRTQEAWLGWPLGMVIGGAVGNIIDRFRFGAVADFFDVHVAGYHWPAFNIADSAIVIGVAIIAWRSLILPKAETM